MLHHKLICCLLIIKTVYSITPSPTSYTCYTGDLRLENTYYNYDVYYNNIFYYYQISGRLDYYYNSQWGTICNNYFNNQSAIVACKQLGYSTGMYTGAINSNIDNTQCISLNDVSCIGTESALEYCSYDTTTSNCDHYDDVIISCFGNSIYYATCGYYSDDYYFGCSSYSSSSSSSSSYGIITGSIAVIIFVVCLVYCLRNVLKNTWCNNGTKSNNGVQYQRLPENNNNNFNSINHQNNVIIIKSVQPQLQPPAPYIPSSQPVSYISPPPQQYVPSAPSISYMQPQVPIQSQQPYMQPPAPYVPSVQYQPPPVYNPQNVSSAPIMQQYPPFNQSIIPPNDQENKEGYEQPGGEGTSGGPAYR